MGVFVGPIGLSFLPTENNAKKLVVRIQLVSQVFFCFPTQSVTIFLKIPPSILMFSLSYLHLEHLEINITKALFMLCLQISRQDPNFAMFNIS